MKRLAATLVLTLALTAGGARASQQYEPLADSVRAALHLAISDRAAPDLPAFSSPQKQLWLGTMSERLAKRMPDAAGRIPSDRGYRYYVEALMRPRELPLAVQQTIRHQFHQAEGEVEEWAHLAAAVLAARLSYAAVVTAPQATRPRLPWGIRVPRLIEDPTPGLALIAPLRNDPSETVRRSVANHLNDVAKDHPDLAVATVRNWAATDPPVERSMLAHVERIQSLGGFNL